VKSIGDGTASFSYQPTAVAVDEARNRAYAASNGDGPGYVLVFDTSRNALVKILDVPGAYSLAAVSERARLDFTDDLNDSFLSVVDTSNDTVVGQIPMAPQGALVGGGMTLSPDHSRLYVVNNDGISVVDTATDSVVMTFPASGAAGLATLPDG